MKRRQEEKMRTLEDFSALADGNRQDETISLSWKYHRSGNLKVHYPIVQWKPQEWSHFFVHVRLQRHQRHARQFL